MFRVTHVEEEGGEIHVAMLMLAINCADEEEAFKMTPQHPLATLLLSCTRFFLSFEKETASHQLQIVLLTAARISIQ